jgi:serine/threonine protein kinase/anti-anti-sigma regulatory factor
MSRDSKASTPPVARSADAKLETMGEAGLVTVTGLVDERFEGFGQIGKLKALVIDVSGLTRMTSFGVRQWLKSMDALPKSIGDIYLLGCPTFFVDQLNMVLNFGGTSKVLTVVAPYTCSACGAESGEIVDVLGERASLAKEPPEKACSRCSGKLEFDETPESYFAFATKYGATNIQPVAAELLAAKRLYAASGTSSEKPPRTIKLVHGSVTYFRIIGTIGAMFRARPFVVGAEGEVVIDLAEVERFDPAGLKEWRRLIKTLAGQVSHVTIVDIGESTLKVASDTLTMARNIVVSSLLAPFQCVDCKRVVEESESLQALSWPPVFEDRVCTICGGTTRCTLAAEIFRPLQKASMTPPPATAKLVEARDEILSRALTDAVVAQAGSGATAVSASDAILGKYKIMRRLSGGGMAEVFLAKQVGIGGFEKPVALKRIQSKLLETRQQAIELFLNEAKIVGRLTHPNIVQVLDVGEVGGALYLAMEYVHGKDLREVVKFLQRTRSKLPLPVTCFIVREVAQALDHAYWSSDVAGQRLAVVHRDVSPHNVILGYDGTVKLLDFGVATSAITENAEKLIVGKWMYMAPETTTSTVPDHRSDLFSLGVVLYLLCCGAMPFGGADPKAIVRKIQDGDYIPVVELAPEVPAQLERLIARLLAPDPADRPQRGQEVVAELNEIMRQHILEASGPEVAELLQEMFPQLAPGTSSDPVKQVIRAHTLTNAEDDTRVVTSPGVENAPASITPSAGTGYRASEQSMSFPRTTTRNPTNRSKAAAPMALPMAKQRLPQPSRAASRFITALLLLLVAGLIGFVAFMVLSSY